MSANPNRRGLLTLLGVAPIAAAGRGTPARAFGTLRAGFAGERISGLAGRFGPGIERALPLDHAIPEPLARLTVRLASDADVVLAQMAAEARATAALALDFPAEISAYRSFGAPMRRRLYADLLARQSERLASLSEPPPTPPASPGPGA